MPSPMIHLAGKIRYAFTGGAQGDDDKPPKYLSFVYGFDPAFDKVGEAFLEYFKSYCFLQPDGAVLDVGSGIGRCAMPLTGYLNEKGLYRGIELREDGVEWCKSHIESKFPHFQFQHVDIQNATYHRGGKVTAENYQFPFEDNSFNLVFTKSVFTHLQHGVIRQYLRETARVLKPGGYCLHTFFLLNDGSRELQEKGYSQFDFKYPVEHGAAVSRLEPEKAIAFDENEITRLYKDAGLAIENPIHYGSWSGRTDGLSGQDIIVARKISDQ